jgi:hypothetical protein
MVYEFFSGVLGFFGLHLPNWTAKEHLTVMVFSVFYMAVFAWMYVSMHHGVRALLRLGLTRGVLPIRVRDDRFGIKVMLAKAFIIFLRVICFLTGNVQDKGDHRMICAAPSNLSQAEVSRAFAKTLYDEAKLRARDFDFLFVLGTDELEAAIHKVVESEYGELLAKLPGKPEYVRIECHTIPDRKGETTITAFVYANRAGIAGAPHADIIPEGNKG